MLHVEHLKKSLRRRRGDRRPVVRRRRGRVRLHRRAVRAAARRRCSSASPACSSRPPARSGSRGAPVDGPPDTMALVFQEYSRSLFPWMTVRQNVAFPLSRRKLGKQEPARLVEEALGSVGLGGRARPLPVAALGRHAAARRDRPRARLPAADPADGRAVRVGRRADARRPRGPRAARSGRQYDVTIVFVTHDIDESVYLSDRDHRAHAVADRGCARRSRSALPQPRDQVATKELPEFARLRAHVWRTIKRPDEAEVAWAS